MKTICKMVLTMLMVFSFASCGGGDDSPSSNNNIDNTSSILGTWELQTVNGSAPSVAGRFSFTASIQKFEDDEYADKCWESGSYTFSDTYLTYSIDNVGGDNNCAHNNIGTVFSGPASISGNILTTEYVEGNTVFTWLKQ